MRPPAAAGQAQHGYRLDTSGGTTMAEHGRPGNDGDGKTPHRDKDGRWPKDKPIPSNDPTDPKDKDE
ncbi:hypothetical protein B4N89_29055 [Embleya scabrispora]|uniref:Uncharacterized protein n=1 Tax=Embleya scabrispora TaxID=159449 RepID=A0A1T3P950_9ACTN|nr:hypothetical protein B4N89_29055 [Embleya scabrispora]